MGSESMSWNKQVSIDPVRDTWQRVLVSQLGNTLLFLGLSHLLPPLTTILPWWHRSNWPQFPGTSRHSWFLCCWHHWNCTRRYYSIWWKKPPHRSSHSSQDSLQNISWWCGIPRPCLDGEQTRKQSHNLRYFCKSWSEDNRRRYVALYLICNAAITAISGFDDCWVSIHTIWTKCMTLASPW